MIDFSKYSNDFVVYSSNDTSLNVKVGIESLNLKYTNHSYYQDTKIYTFFEILERFLVNAPSFDYISDARKYFRILLDHGPTDKQKLIFIEGFKGMGSLEIYELLSARPNILSMIMPTSESAINNSSLNISFASDIEKLDGFSWDDESFTSLFPSKNNIPSRYKSSVCQDIQYSKELYFAFEEINPFNYFLAAGEILHTPLLFQEQNTESFRFTSTTGLKGMGKPFHGCSELGKKLEDSSGNSVVIDAICGINSLKGDINTIRYAIASAKWRQLGNKDYPDFEDIELINSLSENPPVVSVNIDGAERNLCYGLINVNFNDNSSTYWNFKNSKIPFEMVKLLKNIDEDIYNCSMKSLNLPKIYKIRQIERVLLSITHKVFDVKTSFVDFNSIKEKYPRISTVAIGLPYTTDLLREGRGSFYVKGSKHGTIYIPSAETLSTFTSEIENEDNISYIYHRILVSLNSIIRGEGNIDVLVSELKKFIHENLLDSYTPHLKTFYGKQILSNIHSNPLGNDYHIRIPKNSYKKIAKKLDTDEIYCIPNRHPFLWPSQFIVAKLLPGDYNELIEVSSPLFLLGKSDSDGDLIYPIIGDKAFQDTLRQYHDSGKNKPTDTENLWFKDYYIKETSQLPDFSIPYQVHKLTKKDYLDYLYSASYAKQQVGYGTIQYWIASDLIDIYMNNGEIYSSFKFNIDISKSTELKAIYAIILQSFVIEGIKHTENGSDSFNKYLIEGINHNGNFIKALEKEEGSVFVNSKKLVLNLYTILLASNKHNLNIASIISDMYSHYNGGKKIEKDEKFYEIVKMTTFYNLIKPHEEFCNLLISKYSRKNFESKTAKAQSVNNLFF